MEQTQGLIAILDALGAASFTDAEIEKFLTARSIILQLIKRHAALKNVATFTFNDTVLLACPTPAFPSSDNVHDFCELLRRFEVNAIHGGILFRGAIAVGHFYVEESSNTVLGAAVSDAAAWYDSAEWIGIHTTPHATIAIDALQSDGGRDLRAVLVDYDVPLKMGQPRALKAINWPKGFFVRGLAPTTLGKTARANCLRLLSEHRIPIGAEDKYVHSIAFFDYCAARWKKERSVLKKPKK